MIYLNGHEIFSSFSKQTENLLNNSQKVPINGGSNYWKAFTLNKPLPSNTPISVSFNSTVKINVNLYSCDGVYNVDSKNSAPSNSNWRWIANPMNDDTNGNNIRYTFIPPEQINYPYLIFFASNEKPNNTLSNVMVNFGLQQYNAWAPSSYDLDQLTKNQNGG